MNAIELLQNKYDSVVTVTGKTYQMASVPDARVTVDPRTGGLMAMTARRLQFQEKKGAGVIISSDGHIVTNTHIIFGSQEILVTFRDGKEIPARILFISREDDFSILQAKTDRPLKAVEFAEPNQAALGEEVNTIGHSDLLKGTISGGIISGLGTRQTEQGPVVELLRLNINHYSGDSGGPVFDRAGRLIGLISSKRLSAERELFAVPADKIHFADISLDKPGKKK